MPGATAVSMQTRLWWLVGVLAACGGSADEVKATIGPSGGEIAASDGAFKLRFPAGAVAADTEVTIRPGADDIFLPGTSW